MLPNNKKIILYLVTQSELGGAQHYVLDLAKNLRDEFNVVVGIGEQGESGDDEDKDDREPDGFQEPVEGIHGGDYTANGRTGKGFAAW